MNSVWIFYALAIGSVLIADFSQIILKKAAQKEYSAWYKAYLNFPVIFAYGMFVLSTVCSVVALRRLPLSLTPVWNSLGQIMVVVLSYFFLKEKVNRKKLVGIAIIVAGLVLFSL